MVMHAEQSSQHIPDSAGLRVCLLGGFRVLVDDHEIGAGTWRLRKASSLVKLLALSPGYQLHRDQISEQLWPDRSPASAANNLRVTLHTTRRILEPHGTSSPMMRLQGERLALDPQLAVWVDVVAFEEAAGRCASDPEAHEIALNLYSGDLLPEDPYEDWLNERRETLRQTYLRLLLGLARLRENREEPEQAIAALNQAVAHDCALEEAHVGLMRVHALTGNRVQALRQYQQLRDALRRELDVKPDRMSQRLYEAILANRFPGESGSQTLWLAPVASGREQRTAVQDQTVHNSNLPAETSSFVGRDRDIAGVRQALGRNRLVTLTGAGGSGKTRLALRVASQLLEEYVDGVWLVELAGVTDPAMVVHTVASTLSVPENPRQPPGDALATALEGRRLLLVLDNCEHHIAACAYLSTTLLNRCPELRILATSREALRLPGEAARRVPPLPVFSPGCGAEIETVDAVRLFVDRAQLVQPDFAVSARNAGAVNAICTRLDGLPLAIELAAARMRALSVEQIAERVDNTLRLLTGGARTAPRRQQTLWASIDWSYDLLDSPDQLLLMRLSVFAGGSTLEAIEAVLDLLFHLVDKSLVVVQELEGDVRYRLLEPVRQYAVQRLEDDGHLQVLCRRHLNWCLVLAEQSDEELRGPEQQEWLCLLEREHDNLRAALGWAATSYETEQGLRLAAALGRFWFTHGYLMEGRRWLTTFLDRTRISDAGMEYGRALFAAGRLAYAGSDLPAAIEFFNDAISIASEKDDRDYVAGALTQLGLVALRQGHYAAAREQLETAIPIRRALGQDWHLAVARAALGRVAIAQGRFDEARVLCEAALEFLQDYGDAVQTSVCLTALAQMAQAKGDLASANDLYNESLAIVRSVGHRYLVANTLSALGNIARDQGQMAQARDLLGQSLELYRELGIRQSIDDCLQSLAGLS